MTHVAAFLRRERHPYSDGKAVTEGSCRKLHPGDLAGNVPYESASVFAKRHELLDGKEPRLGEGCV